MNQVTEGKPGLENTAEGVEPKHVVPLKITDKRERVN
jgi:hypothetical protein